MMPFRYNMHKSIPLNPATVEDRIGKCRYVGMGKDGMGTSFEFNE